MNLLFLYLLFWNLPRRMSLIFLDVAEAHRLFTGHQVRGAAGARLLLPLVMAWPTSGPPRAEAVCSHPQPNISSITVAWAHTHGVVWVQTPGVMWVRIHGRRFAVPASMGCVGGFVGWGWGGVGF